MVRLLSKLFNIRTNEWPRLLLLYLMALVVTAGLVWGETIVVAAFLEQLTEKALPWFFIVKALVSIPAVAIYTAFADRVANSKLLIAISAIGVLGIVGGLVLLSLGISNVAYPLLYLLIYVPLGDILAAHWYTYVNGFYDTRSAKRIVPVLGTAIAVGGIVAGLTMSALNRFLPPSGIILIWLSTLVVMALGAWLMPYLLREGKAASERSRDVLSGVATGRGKARSSYLEDLREGYHYVLQSPFLRWMAVSALVLMVILTSLEFRTSQIVLGELKTTENMSNFFGRVIWIANLIILPIQLFLLSRIIGRIGLGNANLIFPGGIFAICGGLIFLPGLPTAALAYFGRLPFYSNIGYPIDSLLYNAVPLRVKGRARAFISGLIVPIGSGIGGGLLLLLPHVPLAWFLPGLIGLLVAAFVTNALLIRSQYARALIKMLEQEDFSFLLSQEASELAVTDPAMLNRLRKKLEESTSHEFTVFMAKLITQIGGSEAVPILGQAARAVAEARTRSAILDVLSAADLRGDAVSRLYIDFLADPDSRVRQSAIAGLDQLYSPADQSFLTQMLQMVQDPDLDVRVQVLTGLVDAGDFYQLTPAVQELDRLLADENPHHRARGVRVLGQIGNYRAVGDLMEYLADPADEVRLEAAVAVEAQSRDVLPKLKAMGRHIDTLVVEKVSPLLQDPIERVRGAALAVLGRVGTHESHRLLVGALTDSSSQVREAAVDALAQVGKAVIPIVHPKLDSPDSQLRKMATVVLSRVDRKEFGALIVGSSIVGNLLTIYRNYGLIGALSPCTEYPSVAVLQSALREQNQRLVDEIFYLLAAVHDPDAIKVISESLRSEIARVRANAAEALESLTTPQTVSLMAPLFEPDLPPEQLLSLSKNTWDMEHPNTTQAIRQLVVNPGDPWLRAITTFALGEIGAAFGRGDRETGGEGEKETRREGDREGGHRARRSPPGDLFAALTDNTKDSAVQQSEVSEPEERKTRRTPPADLFGALDATIMDVSFQSETRPVLSKSGQFPFMPSEIEAMLEASLADPVEEVRLAAQAAKRAMSGLRVTREEAILLSTIERIIFLKEVPFFQSMTVDQLKVLANVCEEELFEKDTRIFNEGDPGGVLYVVVNGRVGIEQEKRKGSFARLADIEAHSYFGEMNLFDNSPRSTSAVAIQDTLTLRLRREPLIALARQHPDLSLELINVLSQRLREASGTIAERTRARPRELHKLYDQFD